MSAPEIEVKAEEAPAVQTATLTHLTLARWLKLIDRGYAVTVADDIRAILSGQP